MVFYFFFYLSILVNLLRHYSDNKLLPGSSKSHMFVCHINLHKCRQIQPSRSIRSFRLIMCGLGNWVDKWKI